MMNAPVPSAAIARVQLPSIVFHSKCLNWHDRDPPPAGLIIELHVIVVNMFRLPKAAGASSAL